MKGRILSIILIVLIGVTSVNSSVFASEQVRVILDGKVLESDVPAQVINGRTMVPARVILEALGMTVTWNEETQGVTAIKKGVAIGLTIDSTTAIRNMVEQTIDVPAQIINGRTLVPVRFVSEFAGATVEWDDATQTVYIKSTDAIKYLNWDEKFEYWGEMEGNIVTGYGVIYYKEDGTIFKMGKFNNFEITAGMAFYEDGDIFMGQFKNGTASDGTYIWDDGSSYIGQFVNGSRSGYGRFYNAEQNVTYIGNYVNGCEEGTFTIIDDNLGITFDGLFKNGEYLGEISQNVNSYPAQDAYYYDVCAVQGCNRAPYSYFDYCLQHKCMDSTCRNMRTSIVSFYCENHECMMSGCTSNRVSYGIYCTRHECKVPGCYNSTNTSSSYCVNHKCIYSSCNQEKAFNSMYCIYHNRNR